MKIHYDSILAKIVTFIPGFSTIMLFGDLFTEKSWLSERTIRHEETHSLQYKSLFLLGCVLAFITIVITGFTIGMTPNMFWAFLIPVFLFYVWYLVEWLVRFVIQLYWDGFEDIYATNLSAYRRICFEEEARYYEYMDPSSGEDPAFMSFLKFI